MSIIRKPILLGLVIALSVSIYPAFAQNDVRNGIDKKVLDLDNTLTATITATLTGLSLTGASFLVNVERGINDDKIVSHIRVTRKSFIKAFFMFLICTVLLFVFDFIEVLDQRYIILSTFLDVVTTYTFFGLGIVYLAIAARKLYATYGK